MTKKKPSPQNRIWEKERRERLNKTFEDLHRLLPDHEPSSALTKVEILQQTIEFIGKLQKKIKDLMQECNDPLKDQLHEQEKRLKRLLGRNEELAELLRKAKIAVPPCKYTVPEEERQQRGEEKENGNRAKKTETKRGRPSAAAKKQPVINQKHPVSHSGSTGGSDALALGGVNSVSMTTNAPAMAVSSSSPGGVQSAPGSLALKHINGLSIGPGNGVNVTPALLSTPIMTTSVLISNNGNLMQMPLVAPPSSLLIVGSEDVRAKLNLKSRAHGGGKGKSKRGKFVIKSIDVIPGRIVDGKIPIQPLRRNTNESGLKGSKMSKLKRKRSVDKGKQSRKATVGATHGVKPSGENGSTESKRAKRTDDPSASAGEVQSKDNQQPQSAQKESEVAIGTDQSTASLLPAADKTIRKEYEKENQPNPGDDPQAGHLEQIHLHHPDLSEDIFANLQVPGDSNAHGSHDDGSLSPTAAYLMNFPLVAGGGKAAGNHIEAGDGDECDEGVTVAELQTAKKDNASSETLLSTTGGGGTEASGNMMLDNFSSFFNYGQMETIGAGIAPSVGQEGSILHSLPVASTSNVATVTTVAAPPSTRENGFSSYTSTYQSIDTMLDHRPTVPNRTTMVAPAKIPVTSSESDYGASVAFTFTLTSGTQTAPTTSQTGATIATNHFYGPTCGALATNPVVKPVVDDFCSPLKPSIEFTFSLTSTTGSQPRTVQSQYTNSAILATTMTTPSYDTYGYYHKTVPQTGNYCPSFGVLDPLLTTEKPATSFTFCLTSSTKTEPSYTQSSLATVATHTSQVYETAPKLSTKHPQQGVPECYPLKNAAPKQEKASQRSHGSGGHVSSLGTDGHTNGMHPQTSIQSAQQTTSSNAAATSSSSSSLQQNSQSRYDVSWMAAGTHNESAATNAAIHHSHQQHQQHQQQQQQQQSQPYELAPAQIISSLEFPVPSAGYSASYKSDIFFAHPPGEENNLTWSSPSKLSNILNDSSSPYFPPVTLPSLNGDLALNTSIGTGTGASAGSYKAGVTGTAKKGQLQGAVGGVGQGSEGTPGSSFLSVSQLVNQPSKPSYHGHGATSCQQKPPNNNYSAEALIGNNTYNPNAVSLGSAGHDPARKDKLFDYGIVEGAFGSSSVPSSAALTFNFDTYGAPSGADFNKGYNFATQQNGYVPPYATDGGGYAGVPGGCAGPNAGTSGSTGLPYYGKTSTQGYCYQQASVSSASATTYPSHVSLPPATHGGVASTGQDFTPYYLPTFGEKTSTTKQFHGITHCSSGSTGSSVGKVKKPHKTTGATSSAVDFAFPATVTSAASYSYPTLGNSTTSAPISSGTTGDSTLQVEPHSYPHYHHQQQQDQRLQHHHHYGSSTSEASSTLPSSSVSYKSSSTGPYNYRQYSSSSGGFGSVKSSKTTHQERNHHQDHHQASFPPVHGSTHQSHPHLDLSSCLNPPSAEGYGNHPSQSTLGGHVPQPTVSYGTSVSSSSSSSSSSRQHTSTAHPNSSSHHHQRHGQQQSVAPGASPSSSHTGTTNVSANAAGSCGTLTNFNLSAICPEINDKSGRSRDDARATGMPPVPLSVASLLTHW